MKLLGDIGGTLVNFLSSKNALEAISSVWPHNDSLKNIPIKFLIESTAHLLGAAAFGFDGN
ncbi:MAG: hypothetical protein VXZ60_03760 [Pseudomonadota bacterium]|nr:hypothetical protein [Pseudomonadota bacterium]MEC8322757.1 hypothetical protein [Pseudomonadota bacterium]